MSLVCGPQEHPHRYLAADSGTAVMDICGGVIATRGTEIAVSVTSSVRVAMLPVVDMATAIPRSFTEWPDAAPGAAFLFAGL